MIAVLAAAVVYLTALDFIGLAMGSFFAPSLIGRFLLAFARTPVAHYLELGLRLVVGGAFLAHAPQMLFHTLFTVFGWVLVVTTVGMFVVPWHWHRRFSERSVPQAVRCLPLLGIAAFALGSFILLAATWPAV